jgi:hypothetical protein
MTTPEGKVRDPVVAWAKANGFLHFRMSFRPGVKQGVPDDLFVVPGGVHCWCEFKREGAKPTPLQLHRLAQLNEQGVIAFWADNKDTAITVLSRILNTATLASAQGDR